MKHGKITQSCSFHDVSIAFFLNTSPGDHKFSDSPIKTVQPLGIPISGRGWVPGSPKLMKSTGFFCHILSRFPGRPCQFLGRNSEIQWNSCQSEVNLGKWENNSLTWILRPWGWFPVNNTPNDSQWRTEKSGISCDGHQSRSRWGWEPVTYRWWRWLQLLPLDFQRNSWALGNGWKCLFTMVFLGIIRG